MILYYDIKIVMSDYVYHEIERRIKTHEDYEVAKFEHELGNRQIYIELYISTMVEYYKEMGNDHIIPTSKDIKAEYEYVNADWEKYDKYIKDN